MKSTLFKDSSLNQLQKKESLKGQLTKLKPSDLMKQQTNGTISEEQNKKMKIIQYQNLADNSANTYSKVNIDEPLFQPIPSLLQFNDYEPLQIKEQKFRLRNKDKFARRVKIIQPDSRLFQVIPLSAVSSQKLTKSYNHSADLFSGNKVAPGMEIQFIIRFSPEAKIDYNYDLIVETEREKFTVPIRAIGKRAMIDFPDSLDFGNVPVKYVTEKPVIIRNLGEKTSKWQLKLPKGFDSDKKEGVLEYGKNEQIIIQFYPTEAILYKNEAVLFYDGLEAYIPMTGKAQNGNVYLSKQQVLMDESYIGLQTQQTVQIVNKSDVKVDFQWRAFKTQKEEKEKKNRLRLQLEQEEAEEKMLLKEIVSNEVIREEMDIDEQDESDDEEKDEKLQAQKRQKKAEMLLAMKYKNIEKAIDDEMLLFQDDIFGIEPLQGQIWPKSEMTITVTFRPQLALHYNCLSYLNITYSEQRIPLALGGEGQGPKAVLSANDINIGDIFIGEQKREQLVIENKGEIEAEFQLLKSDTPFGKMFSFDLDRGILEVQKRMAFEWCFRSSILGEFSETFKWKLEGSTDMLSVIFTGHVMAPKFQFNPSQIDFGKASFSFPKPKTIKLQNKSNVDFKFNLRIPGDGRLSQKEFEIHPSSATLKAKDTMNIEVVFIPLIPKTYDMVMVIDLEGIGQDMFSLPIRGVCEVPNVTIEPHYDLSFGDIFIRNMGSQEITLFNQSNLRARYELLPQTEETKILAEYRINNSTGIIEPNQRLSLQMELITKKLGEISLPLAINIVGSNQNHPHVMMITANSIGPIVDVVVRELDFGQVQVLENKSMFVKIKNRSTIQAEFHCFTKKKPSPFQVLLKHGQLKPWEELSIEIVCCADEANRLTDTLHFIIKEGKDVDVALKARSAGHTIFWKDNLEHLDFGVLYTHRSKINNILIENKGNQSQMLQWSKREENKKKLEDKNQTKKSNNNLPEEEEDDTFQIIPDRLELPARSGYIFQFKAYATNKGRKTERFSLFTTLGKERKQQLLTTANLDGVFIIPQLLFSEQKLSFNYQWQPNSTLIPVTRVLEITNGSQLPTNFTLKVDQPFSISQDNFALLANDKTQVQVEFDPNYRLDKISGDRKSKLSFMHNEHPHKEYVDLVGRLFFPNLSFETQQINFGAILIETQKKVCHKMTNDSKMAVNYEWSFQEEEAYSEQNIRLNEIFDILPLSGCLQPGESEDVEFIFYSLLPQKFRTTAVCRVEGGPDYEIQLVGDSSSQDYRMSSSVVEVGEVKYNDWVQREIYLENTGKVTFNFKVLMKSIIRKGLVEVTPLEGKVVGHEKFKFQIKICPGYPDLIQETFQIQCGYFEPHDIVISGRGIFPSIITNLAREPNALYVANYEKEKNNRNENEQKIIEQHQADFQHNNLQNTMSVNNTLNPNNKNLKNYETIIQEIEQECDRKQLCQLISDNLQKQNKDWVSSGLDMQMSQLQQHSQKYFDGIILSNYILDFGNIVLNSHPKKKVFKLTNTGNLVCDLSFDQKVFKNAGYTINPEKISKMAKGQSQNIIVTFSSKNRKNQIGKNKTIVPLDIKNGPKYQLELVNNITFPEIYTEKDEIDFGRVLVNQRKTVYVRFMNRKEVECVWEVKKQNNISSSEKKDEQRFEISPSGGVLTVGQKQTIEFSFMPQAEKHYNFKFVIGIQENGKPLVIYVKGQGSQVQLEYSPEVINAGPVLPYNDQCYALLEVRNPSDYDTELYSLDFDHQYLKEERQLAAYDQFQPAEPLYLPVRKPAAPFWNHILLHNQKVQNIQNLNQQIQNKQSQITNFEKNREEARLLQEQEQEKLKQELAKDPKAKAKMEKEMKKSKQNFQQNQQEEKKEDSLEDLEQQLKELQIKLEEAEQMETVQQEVQKVDDDQLHHVVIYGPPKSGKTKLARALNKEHQRHVLSLEEVVEWNINNNTPVGHKIQQHLQKQQEDMEVTREEREKILKKAGKKAAQYEQVMGAFREQDYSLVGEEMLVESVQNRLKEKDCNAGVIFDNLQSKYNGNSLIGLKVIMQAIKQHLQLVVLNHQQQKTQSVEQQELNPNLVLSSDQLQEQGEAVTPNYSFPNQQDKQEYEDNLYSLQQLIQGELHKFSLKELTLTLPTPFENPEDKLAAQAQAQKEAKNQKKDAGQMKQEEEEIQRQEQLEQEQQQQQLEAMKHTLYNNNNRSYNEVGLMGDTVQQLQKVLEVVPSPIYPDPNTLPTPSPLYQQVIFKPTERRNNKNTVKHYQILTPFNMYKPDKEKTMPTEKDKHSLKLELDQNQMMDQSSIENLETMKEEMNIQNDSLLNTNPDQKEDNKSNNNNNINLQLDNDAKSLTQDKKETEEVQKTAPTQEQSFKFEPEQLQENIYRWVVPAKKTLQLVVKFFTKEVGEFNEQLEFENFYGLKKNTVRLQSKSDFPNISQKPKDLFENIRRTRAITVPECYLSHKFVISENLFDFGPLLINKQMDTISANNNKNKNINSDVFRIINTGRFDCELEVGFSSSALENQSEDKKTGIFRVEPQTLTIKGREKDEQKEEEAQLRVWALPDGVEEFRDDLVIMIKNNPIPVIVPLKCLGQKPVIQVLQGESLKFQRLLLNQTSSQQIVLKNISAIPLKWNLSGLEELPQEFSLQNTSGKLLPNKETTVEVTFKAIQQQIFSQKVWVEVQDVENQGIKQEPQEISIGAEAFDISTQFKFPEQTENNSNGFVTGNLLDFGSVRVGEIKEQSFTIKNNGLYKIKYKFRMNKKIYRECFTIEPKESELEAGMEKTIQVRFLSKHQEMKLKTSNNTTDIFMEILEGTTQELFKPVAINVNVNSVYSKFTINPLKKINFGPTLFNEQKIRHFEIKNEGIFEVNFNIFDYFNEEARKQIKEQNALEMEQLQQLAGQDKGGKGKEVKKKEENKGKGGKQVQGNQLKVGQFMISPYSGSIGPDQSQSIEMVFIGQGQQIYEQKLGIDISCRDPKDEPEGIVYEMVGESCIPGIQTDNYQSIFEEQVVVTSIQSAGNIAQLVDSNIFAVEEKIFFFGTLVPSQVPDGVVEKFKIINGNKVGCSVSLEVRKRTANQMEQFGFEVEPKQVKIAAHDHCYVKVIFKPTIMATYAGVFEAVVEQGEQNTKTQKLQFDLRAEGVLPTLKLEQPKDYIDERTPVLKFSRLRVNKSSVLPIVLKNDGSVPATVKFDTTYHNCFRFLSAGSYTFAPKSYQQFQVEFNPKEPKMHSHTLALQTLLNPYENFKLQLQGEGFYDEVSFEQLPFDKEDQLDLEDCYINQSKKHQFCLKNNSDQQIKFNWNLQGISQLSVSPSVGHLQPGQVKAVTMTFLSDKTITLNSQVVILETKQIKQESEVFQDWDDSMTQVRYISQNEYDFIQAQKAEEEEKKKQEEQQQKNQKGKQGQKSQQQQQQINSKQQYVASDKNEIRDIAYEQPIDQPEHQQLSTQDKQIKLKVNATCDLARYECEVQQVMFKPTMMFTTRLFQFKVKNISQIVMQYDNLLVASLDNLAQQPWNPGYYSIAPKQGSIKPGCDELFTLKFSPTEVDMSNLRHLYIQIDHLTQEQQPLLLSIEAEAERPICHFELPPVLNTSDRDNMKTVEFESLGCKIKNTKRFYIVNATASGYDFEWRKVEEEVEQGDNQLKNNSSNYFRCITQKGSVLSGKKYEVIFEYSPEQTGNHLAYYTFYIPEYKIEQQFQLSGKVIDPKVFLTLGKVNFGPLLLSGKNKETVYLKNLEDVPISFYFDKESIKGEPDYNNSLQVSPINGVVKPESEIPIEVVFQPKNEISYNYNLSCNVQRKSRPINLNVKGIGYILHHSVAMEDNNQVLSSQDISTLNFDDIYVREKRVKRLIITNNGDFNFDFSMRKSALASMIHIKPENGTVRKHEKLEVEVIFSPTSELKFKGKASRLSLQIISGPIYHFDIRGSARKPNVEVSFYHYNFGPQFFLKRPLPVSTILTLKNKDKTAMSLECKFEKTSYLDVQLANGQVLLPESNDGSNILEVPIVFTPRDIEKYSENIVLDINGLHTMEIKVEGEGVPFKVELEKQEDQIVDFGIAKVGQDVTKVVSVVNLSKKAVNIQLDVDNQLAELKDSYLQVYPADQVINIQPRQKKQLELRFTPQTRLHRFTKELFYSIVENNETRKLLKIEAGCHGLELKLMEDTLGFGPVVVQSKLVKQLQLANLGDIGAHFNWDLSFCKQFFSIQPQQGYIAANEDVYFEVSFHPNVVDNDIRFNQVKCHIEGASSLHVNLLGKGLPMPKEQVQSITFLAEVRQTCVQKVTIKNPTNTHWQIRANISSQNNRNYFSGPDVVEVGPNSQMEYEVTYTPQTMTTNPLTPSIKEEAHLSSVFFPLPDGQAIIYELIGKSQPPQPIQLESKTLRAKDNGSYVIPVRNWLRESQRLAVDIQLEREEPTTFVSGANTMDIMGEAQKDYKLTLESLKPSSNSLLVTCKNLTTHEFIQYKIPLTFTNPEVLAVHELQSVVRESVSKLIHIHNPLDQQVVIKNEYFVTDNDNVTFNPTNFKIPPKSEFGFEVNYRPLITGDFQSKFTLKSPELGDFIYQLQLKGIAQQNQKQLTFKTTLATEIIQTFKFLNYLKKPAQYTVKMERLGQQYQKQQKEQKQQSIDFSLENPQQQQIQAPGSDSYDGTEVSLNLRFEPSSLMECRALLTVSHPEGGEYQCLLIGHGLSPQPRGPFRIAGAKPPPIEFKNPFLEAMDFTIRIDNPSFTASLKSPTKIDAKKTVSITITYKQVPGSTNNGRLMISTEDMPPWVFYLQGE